MFYISGMVSEKNIKYDADPKLEMHASDCMLDSAPSLIDVSSQSNQSANETRLFNLFRPTHHTVLVFASHKTDFHSILAALNTYPADLLRVVTISKKGIMGAFQHDTKITVTLEDRGWHANSIYTQGDATIGVYIIRPGGIIGARVGYSQGIKRYFAAVMKL